HFGGLSDGVKNRLENYRAIRSSILDLGHEITRDWIEKELKGDESLSSQEIYDLTEKAIKEADAVVLEYSDDASALGKQMLLALENEIPVLLLSVKTNVSDGSFVSTKHKELIHKSHYSLDNIEEVLSKFFNWVSNNSKTARFNLELDKKLDNHLREKARINNSSKAEEIRKLIIDDMKRQ
ncbi:MAG: hypothetical protein NTY75_04665, partial [Candidatus Shapirobacteria bacterium]|nr:hypothetical protein [Candidatus Shapirobacteria bacterium]